MSNTEIIQTAFIPYQLDAKRNLIIPAGIKQEDWQTKHRHIFSARKHIGRWLDQHREYGIANYGIEYVSDTESQVLFDLGINLPPPKPDCNGEGKARGFVNIEGISQSIDVWWRTVKHLAPSWDIEQIACARQYIRPALTIDAQLQELMERRRTPSKESPSV